MLGLGFIILVFLFGWILTVRFLPEVFSKGLLLICSSFLLGSFFSVWIIFLLSYLFLSIPNGIIIGTIIIIGITAYSIKKRFISSLKVSYAHLILLLVAFLSFWVFRYTFHEENGIFSIGYNIWGDFEIHIPLIRSFSWGNNIPPAYPAFPQAHLAYHFLFNFYIGILEYLGLPLVSAMNIISALSTTTLLYLIYLLPQIIFKKRNFLMGIITCCLFLFNSSLSFLTTFEKLHVKNISDAIFKIANNNSYLSVGPFSTDIVSIFWDLNTYLNQRHLIFGLALGIFLFIATIHKDTHQKKQFIFLGLLLGLLPCWQNSVFISLVIIFSILFALQKRERKKYFFILLISIVPSFIQMLWLSKDVTSYFTIHIGYLTHTPLTFKSFFEYWIFNLGLSFFFIIFSLFFIHQEERKYYFAFMGIFLVGNIFQFNYELYNNHKFFNIWITFINCYTAFLLIRLLQKKWGITIGIVFFIVLTFSGLIDIPVVINESHFLIPDINHNATIQFIKKSTSPNAIFLTPYHSMYDPTRLAGRKTFEYQSRYGTNYGYAVADRDTLIKKIYRAENRKETQQLLKKNNISYAVLPKEKNSKTIPINNSFFLTYPIVFATNQFSIVKIE